jgi:hypothetical protein
MRTERINVFYYPEIAAAHATLKKAILLFDELHFMDRPAFSFESFGLVGAPSPLRQFEYSFRDNGVPLFVHDAPGGPVEGQFLEQITADIDDPQFLKRFQEGLKVSPTFRQLHIAPGNYGEWGNEQDVYQKNISVDLATDLSSHESPSSLFFDKHIRAFDLSTATGRAKNLVATAVSCSAKLNFALNVSTKQGFIPLADANPYGDLLGAKYARAINKLEPAKNNLQLTDLTFAIFDQLISAERLEKLSFTDIIRYRKASETAREVFLEYLSVLQAKRADVGIDGDYSGVIRKLVATEIVPAARKFKTELDSIGDSLFGALAKGAVGFLGSSSAMQVFTDLSWEKILALAGVAAAYITKVGIDGILADRATRRECSISYVLSLDV